MCLDIIDFLILLAGLSQTEILRGEPLGEYTDSLDKLSSLISLCDFMRCPLLYSFTDSFTDLSVSGPFFIYLS